MFKIISYLPVSKKDILTVGETWQTNPKIIEKYTDPKNKEFSMVFQFSGQGIDTIPGKEKWDYKSVTPQELKKVFTCLIYCGLYRWYRLL